VLYLRAFPVSVSPTTRILTAATTTTTTTLSLRKTNNHSNNSTAMSSAPVDNSSLQNTGAPAAAATAAAEPGSAPAENNGQQPQSQQGGLGNTANERDQYMQLVRQMPEDQLREKMAILLHQQSIENKMLQEANKTRMEKSWSVLSKFKNESAAISEVQQKMHQDMFASKQARYYADMISNVADHATKLEAENKQLREEMEGMRQRYGLGNGVANASAQHAGVKRPRTEDAPAAAPAASKSTGAPASMATGGAPAAYNQFTSHFQPSAERSIGVAASYLQQSGLGMQANFFDEILGNVSDN
jgi:hypothetical protein